MSNKEAKTLTTKNEILKNATGPVTIRLTNDYLFKRLLQENSQVLKSLICSLLHFSPTQVKNVTITNPILPGESITDKTVILDVNVVFNNKSRINLEMQVVNELNWPERSTIYACRNFSKLNKGKKYSIIKPVWQIGFLDFTLFPEYPAFYSTYKLCDIKNHHIFTDKLTIGVVDLTSISLATPEDQRYNIDKWAMLFKSQTWEDIKMLAAQDININAAATTLYQLSEDERIQQQCEAREDYLLREQDLADRIADREKTIAKQKRALTEKDQALAEKDQAIAEKDQAIAEKDQSIASKDEEIAKLKALLASKNQ